MKKNSIIKAKIRSTIRLDSTGDNNIESHTLVGIKSITFWFSKLLIVYTIYHSFIIILWAYQPKSTKLIAMTNGDAKNVPSIT